MIAILTAIFANSIPRQSTRSTIAMRHFKLPLIVTAITFAVAIIGSVILVTMIHRAKISDAEKKARAEKGGAGVALGVLFVITPFWLIGAARMGKERRAARAEQAAKNDSAAEG
jgi:uncharacterized integral membrane protein